MSQKNLPNLRAMSRRLADHNNRVARYVESLPRRVDKLVEATLMRDWSEVRRLSEFLACSSDIFGCSEVAQAAQTVCKEIDEPDNEVAVKRSVIRLISSCGALPEQVAATSISTLDVHPAMPFASVKTASESVMASPVAAAQVFAAPQSAVAPSTAKPSTRTAHSKPTKSTRRASRSRKSSGRAAR